MSQPLKTYDDLKQDFFDEMDFITNLGVKFFIYPFKGRSKLVIFCYFFIYGLLCLTSAQLFVTLCLICINNFDWFEIINVAPNLGVCLMILIKYRKINVNKELYDEIVKHFRYGLWDAISDTSEHKKILNRYTKTTKLIMRIEFYYTCVLTVIVDLFPRIIMFYENDILGKEKQYLYPFDGWYPFDKIQRYYAAYIWESFMTTIVIFIYAFANMLHFTLTRHICMELTILGNTMEGLISNEDVVKIKAQREVEQIHHNVKNKLKFVICRHQFLAKYENLFNYFYGYEVYKILHTAFIYRITSRLDDVLGDAMLLTYGCGSVFICLTAFTATVIDDLYKSMRYFSFCFSLLVDVFFQCIIGQLFIDHSKKLEKAIYFVDWVYADSDTKKMLLIFLMRSQKPIELRAKGYVTMNLDTFGRICTLSYQFFNLLRTVYSD